MSALLSAESRPMVSTRECPEGGKLKPTIFLGESELPCIFAWGVLQASCGIVELKFSPLSPLLSKGNTPTTSFLPTQQGPGLYVNP